jgi:hypothetical protein
LVPNGGFESNLTLSIGSWQPSNAGATTSRVTTVSKFGTASAKVVTDGSAGFSGLDGCIAATAGSTYTYSAWVYSPVATSTPMWLQVYRKTGATCGGSVVGNTNTAFTLTQGWQRVTHTFTAEASTGVVETEVETNGTQPATTFYVDGVQLEQKTIATPYVETNGGTASRSGGRIQAPSTGMNATTGWFAARIRPSWSSSGSLPNGAPGIFEWNNNDNNRIFIAFSSVNSVQVFRIGGGSGGVGPSQAATFNAGDTLTVVGYWTATTVGISINGSAFTTAGQTTIPSSPPATFDIGSLWTHNAGAGEELDGDFLWAAAGAGTLTNSDAASLNAYGNSDPTLASLNNIDSADTATMAWDGEASQYTGTNSTPVSQSGITLDDATLYRVGADQLETNSSIGINIQPSNGVLQLAAATTAAGGIYFGTDTDLYRAAAGTLKTDNRLQVATSLGVGYDPNSISGGVAAFNGNVGIGTTSPGAKLHVYDSYNATSTGNTIEGLFEANNHYNVLTSSTGVEAHVYQDNQYPGVNSSYIGVASVVAAGEFNGSGTQQLYGVDVNIAPWGASRSLYGGNSYLFYGLQDQSTYSWTGSQTLWGVYVSGEQKNYFSGNVGIGQTNPGYKLDVSGTGNFANALTADNMYIGHGSVSGNSGNSITFNNVGGGQLPGTISGGGTLFVDGAALKYRGTGNITTIASDFSEEMPVTSDVVAMDVVSESSQPNPNNDQSLGLAPYILEESQTSYDDRAVGVVSALAGNHTSGMQSVAFAGRVPVHVTNENGPIAPGDYLTSSSTPGYAMKATHAGIVVGKALGSFDPSTGSGQVARGTVPVLVGTSYYNPDTNLQGDDGNFDILTAASVNISGNLTVNGNATFHGDITVAGDIITAASRHGTNVSVTQSSTEMVVNLSSAQRDTAYTLQITPSWVTAYGVVHKGTNSFTVDFDKPAPASATFDWLIIR